MILLQCKILAACRLAVYTGVSCRRWIVVVENALKRSLKVVEFWSHKRGGTLVLRDNTASPRGIGSHCGRICISIRSDLSRQSSYHYYSYHKRPRQNRWTTASKHCCHIYIRKTEVSLAECSQLNLARVCGKIYKKEKLTDRISFCINLPVVVFLENLAD